MKRENRRAEDEYMRGANVNRSTYWREQWVERQKTRLNSERLALRTHRLLLRNTVVCCATTRTDGAPFSPPRGEGLGMRGVGATTVRGLTLRLLSLQEGG